MRSMVAASIGGMMVKCTQVNGRITKWMVKAICTGLMVVIIKVNLSKIDDTALVHSLSEMVEFIQVVGTKANSTARAKFVTPNQKSSKKASGSTANVSAG